MLCLDSCGVGLSLICFSSISVAPVRGGTYFSLPPQREVSKRKRLEAPAKRVPQLAQGSGASGICVRARAPACDKGVILPAALRAPKSRS